MRELNGFMSVCIFQAFLGFKMFPAANKRFEIAARLAPNNSTNLFIIKAQV